MHNLIVMSNNEKNVGTAFFYLLFNNYDFISYYILTFDFGKKKPNVSTFTLCPPHLSLLFQVIKFLLF